MTMPIRGETGESCPGNKERSRGKYSSSSEAVISVTSTRPLLPALWHHMPKKPLIQFLREGSKCVTLAALSAEFRQIRGATTAAVVAYRHRLVSLAFRAYRRR